MHSSLTPFFKHNINGVIILWFKDANEYLVLDEKTNALLYAYLESKNYSHFHTIINIHDTYTKEVSGEFFSEFETLLTSVNTIDNLEQPEVFKNSVSVLDLVEPYICIFYNFNGKLIKICYQSTPVQQFIHPQFSYLEVKQPKGKPDCVFHINSINNQLHLFKNKLLLGSYSSADYHLLQGKFAIELICKLTLTTESDWLATFHASAISNKSEAIMLIGESGSGKSTLSTLLMNHGFDLLSDDFTPMLAKSHHIHPYPSAISIKKNAFPLVDSLSKSLEYKTFKSPNNQKGLLRYVTPNNVSKKSLPCSKIILVNYERDSEVSLDTLHIREALNVLIPDSWISPKLEHVKSFMNWLEGCNFYKLTYSDTNSAISMFETLLQPTR